MNFRCMFVIESEPDPRVALKQVAACLAFAEQIGVRMSMVPEEGPKKERIRWAGEDAKDKEEKAAVAVLAEAGGTAQRKDFVRAFAQKIKTSNRAAGLKTAFWVRQGVLEEVA